MNAHTGLAAKVVSEAFARADWSSWEPMARSHVKHLVADTCAVAIAGATADGVIAARQLALEWGGRPQASLIGDFRKVPAGSAAFANAVASHALDFDDFLEEGGLHAMTVIFPVCLAMAQKHGISDTTRFLAAIAAALETAARLAIHARNLGMDPGWLPASIFSGIGAVIGGALLAGCDEDCTVSAIGLLYGQLGGNRQALRDGTLAKRMQPAFAARDAVLAVELAQLGVTGPHGSLDGVHGLYPLYVGRPAPSPQDYERAEPALMLYRVKPYACCAASHPAIDAAISMRSEIDVSTIASGKVHLPARSFKLVGGPFQLRGNPQVDAQFSAAYAVALALVTGEASLRSFSSASILENATVRELAGRIDAIEIPGSGSLGAWDAETLVEVIRKDGSAHQRRIRGVSGSTSELVRRKAVDCLSFAHMTSADVASLLTWCGSDDAGLSIESIAALLMRVPSKP